MLHAMAIRQIKCQRIFLQIYRYPNMNFNSPSERERKKTRFHFKSRDNIAVYNFSDGIHTKDHFHFN